MARSFQDETDAIHDLEQGTYRDRIPIHLVEIENDNITNSQPLY
ncbi:MAG: hypothetical protein R3F23_00095 [Verrucomicrobiia bacterium]